MPHHFSKLNKILFTTIAAMFVSLSFCEASPYGLARFYDASYRFKNVSYNANGITAIVDSNIINVIDQNGKSLSTINLYGVNRTHRNFLSKGSVNTPSSLLYLSNSDSLYYFTEYGTLTFDINDLPKQIALSGNELDTNFRFLEIPNSGTLFHDIGTYKHYNEKFLYIVYNDRKLDSSSHIIDQMVLYNVEKRKRFDLTNIFLEKMPEHNDSCLSSEIYLIDETIYKMDYYEGKGSKYILNISAFNYLTSHTEIVFNGSIDHIGRLQKINNELVILGNERLESSSNRSVAIYKLKKNMVIQVDNAEVPAYDYFQEFISFNDKYFIIKYYARTVLGVDFTLFKLIDRETKSEKTIISNSYQDYINVPHSDNNKIIYKRELGSYYLYDMIEDIDVELIMPAGLFWNLGNIKLAWSELVAPSAHYNLHFSSFYTKKRERLVLPNDDFGRNVAISRLKPQISNDSTFVMSWGNDIYYFNNIEDQEMLAYYRYTTEKIKPYQNYIYLAKESKEIIYYNLTSSAGKVSLIKYYYPEFDGKVEPETKEVIIHDYETESDEVSDNIFVFDDGTFTSVLSFYKEGWPDFGGPHTNWIDFLDSIVINVYDEKCEILDSRSYNEKNSEASELKELLTLTKISHFDYYIPEHDSRSKTVRRANGSIYDLWNLEFIKQNLDTLISMKTYYIPEEYDFGARYSVIRNFDLDTYSFYEVELFSLEDPLLSFAIETDAPIKGFLGVQEDYVHFICNDRTYHQLKLEDIRFALKSVSNDEFSDTKSKKLVLVQNLENFLSEKGIEKYSSYDLKGSEIDTRIYKGIFILIDNDTDKRYFLKSKY
ncbi:MAG: hypothetical protein Kapaf2KO_23870 [Candidatus Kapaibacteriales bacterium]